MSNNNTIKLNVYDENDKVIKTATAKMVKIKFGTIRAIMKLVKVESLDNTKELLQTVSDVWDKLIEILSKCFPDMTEEDWEYVDVMELIRVVMAIIRFSSKKIEEVPIDEDEKN